MKVFDTSIYDRILEIVAAQSPRTARQDLIAAANAAGGIDNITVIIMKF